MLGVDASVSGDSTALVGVARHPDRPGHPMELVVRIARIWQTTPAHPMDYEATVIQAIREACAQWNVVEVTYDPYQLHDPMLRLRRENRIKVLEFSEQGRRDGSLRDPLRSLPTTDHGSDRYERSMPRQDHADRPRQTAWSGSPT